MLLSPYRRVANTSQPLIAQDLQFFIGANIRFNPGLSSVNSIFFGADSGPLFPVTTDREGSSKAIKYFANVFANEESCFSPSYQSKFKREELNAV